MDSNSKQPPQIPRTELKFPTRTKSLASDNPRAFRWVLIVLIALLLAILVGLIGWLYLLQQTPEPVLPSATRPTAEENNEPESATAEAAALVQQTTSPSTELPAIETDIAGTQIIELDPLFADIEAMFAE